MLRLLYLALRRILELLVLLGRSDERKEIAANPAGRWVAQQARKLVHDLDGRSLQLVIHDRDSKFTAAFDEVFAAEGVSVIRTPVRAPNANAHAERWVRTVRAGCLDHSLPLGRRHLERVLNVYIKYYNGAGRTGRSRFNAPIHPRRRC